MSTKSKVGVLGNPQNKSKKEDSILSMTNPFGSRHRLFLILKFVFFSFRPGSKKHQQSNEWPVLFPVKGCGAVLKLRGSNWLK